MEEGIRQMLEERIRLCKKAGVREVLYIIRAGRLADEIVGVVGERYYDLIVIDENTNHGFVSSITIRKTIPTPINLLRIIRPTLFTQPSLGYNPNRDEDCGAILR